MCRFNEIEREIATLSACISGGKASADTYFRRGRLFWKLDRKGDAISDYEQAIALDPECGAAEALRLSREVMNFYNKDLYNP